MVVESAWCCCVQRGVRGQACSRREKERGGSEDAEPRRSGREERGRSEWQRGWALVKQCETESGGMQEDVGGWIHVLRGAGELHAGKAPGRPQIANHRRDITYW
jgi:hypothetical protein